MAFKCCWDNRERRRYFCIFRVTKLKNSASKVPNGDTKVSLDWIDKVSGNEAEEESV
jgi:hypothetical protein